MIGFDLDGTLFDTMTAMRQIFLSKFNYDIGDTNCYDISVPDIKPKYIVYAIHEAIIKYNDQILPYPDTKIALKKIVKITKQPIIIITARNRELTELTTHQLCKKYILPISPYKIYWASSSQKKEMIMNLGLDYFVEDRLRTANDCAPFLNRVFLLTRPWNWGRPTMPNVNRTRYLTDVADWLKINHG